MFHSQTPNQYYQGFEFAFQALIADFNATRDAELAFIQQRVNLDNFTLLVISAIAVSYQTIVSQDLFLIFPLASLIITGIALTRRAQSRVLAYLGEYEKTLYFRLLEIITLASQQDKLLSHAEHLWQWQTFLACRHHSHTGTVGFIRYSARAGIHLIYLVTTTGFLLLLPYHKSLIEMSLPEAGLLFFAAFFWGLLALDYVQSFVSDLTSFFGLNPD